LRDIFLIRAMIREVFPPDGSQYEGGLSDGFVYEIRFTGKNNASTYQLLKSFLNEEGFSDVVLPNKVEDLLLFKFPPPSAQLSIFDEVGYFHYPIKIFFDSKERITRTFILRIYNEKTENSLLRFFGRK